MKKELKFPEHLSDFDHVRRCITAWYFLQVLNLLLKPIVALSVK